MNANAKKWVKALESGKYKQGRNLLREDDRFCCLGVACDLYLKEHPKAKVDTYKSNYSGKVAYEYIGESVYLPTKVKQWLGLRTRCGEFKTVGETDCLVALNDDGRSFKKIAKMIKSEPKGLFVEEAK